jgi:hypothetical protein
MTDLELCLFGALACLPQVVGRLEALKRRVRRASAAEIAEAGSCGLGSVGLVGTSGKETELTGRYIQTAKCPLPCRRYRK